MRERERERLTVLWFVRDVPSFVKQCAPAIYIDALQLYIDALQAPAVWTRFFLSGKSAPGGNLISVVLLEINIKSAVLHKIISLSSKFL